MRSVVLINIEPFTPGRDKYFHISELRHDQFDVQVWDLSTFSLRGTDFPDVIKEEFVKVLRNLKDIRKALNALNIQDTFFIVQLPFNNKTYPVYKELKKHNCFIATFNFYTNTIYDDDYHIDLHFSWKDPVSFARKFYNKLNNYINWRLYQLKWRNIRYDCNLSPLDGEGITGHINHPDYDNYHFHKEDRMLNYDYLVFCDNYFPYHPDLVGEVDGIDGVKYQKQMSDLFTYLENKTGLPVVIAAHPKAQYKGEEFGNRTIYKYKTNNLVQYSDGVILHTSNSLSYAIMADKQILCVTTDDYSSVGFPFEKSSRYLEIPYYNLDRDDMSNIQFHSISQSVRDRYINTLLTNKESKDTDNYTIIKNTIIKTKYNK